MKRIAFEDAAYVQYPYGVVAVQEAGPFLAEENPKYIQLLSLLGIDLFRKVKKKELFFRLLKICDGANYQCSLEN